MTKIVKGKDLRNCQELERIFLRLYLNSANQFNPQTPKR